MDTRDSQLGFTSSAAIIKTLRHISACHDDQTGEGGGRGVEGGGVVKDDFSRNN